MKLEINMGNQFLRIYNERISKVHIGTDCLSLAMLVCDKEDRTTKEKIGIDYEGEDICKKCLSAYKKGKRAWTSNANAGGSRSSRSMGGYGGSVSND